MGRRVGATASAGFRTRPLFPEAGLEPGDARPSVVPDRGVVHVHRSSVPWGQMSTRLIGGVNRVDR